MSFANPTPMTRLTLSFGEARVGRWRRGSLWRVRLLPSFTQRRRGSVGSSRYRPAAGCTTLPKTLCKRKRGEPGGVIRPAALSYRGVEQSGKLAGFISRRSQVQILPPLFVFWGVVVASPRGPSGRLGSNSIPTAGRFSKNTKRRST